MDEELDVDRSCLSASWPTEDVDTYQGAGLDTVLASLYSGQCVVSIRVAMSVEFRPTYQCHPSKIQRTYHLIASSSSTLRFFILQTARPIRSRMTRPAPTLIPMIAPSGMAKPPSSSFFSGAADEAAGARVGATDSVTTDCMTVTTTVSPPASTESDMDALLVSGVYVERKRKTYPTEALEEVDDCVEVGVVEEELTGVANKSAIFVVDEK